MNYDPRYELPLQRINSRNDGYANHMSKMEGVISLALSETIFSEFQMRALVALASLQIHTTMRTHGLRHLTTKKYMDK